MGEYRSPNGTKSYEPDDTDTEMYFSPGTSNLSYILDRAKEKWGQDLQLDELEISAEHIHTSCIGLDYYDSSDYTNYVVVTRN